MALVGLTFWSATRVASALGFLSAAIFAAVLLGLVVKLLEYTIERNREARDEPLMRLLPLPLPENTHPVQVTVRSRGRLTGLDLGAATFVDGWLHVEGLRTTFAVRASDGEAQWRGEALRLAFLDGQSVSLSYYGDASPIWTGGAHFSHQAKLWAIDREHPEGTPVRPPVELGPGARTLRTANLAAGTSVLGLSGFLVGSHLVPQGLAAALTLGLLRAIFLSVGIFSEMFDHAKRRRSERRNPSPHRTDRSA